MESAVFSGSVAGALFLTTLAGAATVLGAASAFFTRRTNTKVLSVALGLSGGSNAGEKRKALLKKLNLPEHMSANAMLQALNLLYTREELEQMLNESGIERD